jgi:hypothetical protein
LPCRGASHGDQRRTIANHLSRISRSRGGHTTETCPVTTNRQLHAYLKYEPHGVPISIYLSVGVSPSAGGIVTSRVQSWVRGDWLMRDDTFHSPSRSGMRFCNVSDVRDGDVAMMRPSSNPCSSRIHLQGLSFSWRNFRVNCNEVAKHKEHVK